MKKISCLHIFEQRELYVTIISFNFFKHKFPSTILKSGYSRLFAPKHGTLPSKRINFKYYNTIQHCISHLSRRTFQSKSLTLTIEYIIKPYVLLTSSILLHDKNDHLFRCSMHAYSTSYLPGKFNRPIANQLQRYPSPSINFLINKLPRDTFV